MDNLGEYIKQQREAKKMTLEELSSQTKISLAVLRDIENGKFDRYKGDEAYVKMYLKKISNVLNMDNDELTHQYIELTKEIALEELHEKEELQQHNQEVVTKGKRFSFEAPQLTRKPSVYEDKSHVTIIRTVIILILVCLVIVVVWFGIYSTRSKTPEPDFVPQNNTTVEGEVDTGKDENEGDKPDSNQQTTPSTIEFTRNGMLDFSFKLPSESEKFTLKIEFGNKSWAELRVNGIVYDDFKSKIYSPAEDGTPETVELEFNVADVNNLTLRVGYSAGHHYYINGQEIPLIDEDTSYGASNLNLTLEKE